MSPFSTTFFLFKCHILHPYCPCRPFTFSLLLSPIFPPRCSLSYADAPRPSTSSQPFLICRSIGASFSHIGSRKTSPAPPLASVAPAGYAPGTEVLHDGGDCAGVVACVVGGARLTPGPAIVLAKGIEFSYVVTHCRWLRSLVVIGFGSVETEGRCGQRRGVCCLRELVLELRS
jgi:hypothetical protein